MDEACGCRRYITVMTAPLLLPRTADKRLLGLAQHWLSLRPGTDTLPGHQHFTASGVSALLPWMWLFEVHRPGLCFRFRGLGRDHVFRWRFQGGGHTVAMGRENTGLWVDEVRKLRSEPAYDRFINAVDQQAIGYYKGPPTFSVGHGYIGIERLILPLACDGCTVDMLLGITVYSRDGAAATGMDA
jgi:hypothetical protein